MALQNTLPKYKKRQFKQMQYYVLDVDAETPWEYPNSINNVLNFINPVYVTINLWIPGRFSVLCCVSLCVLLCVSGLPPACTYTHASTHIKRVLSAQFLLIFLHEWEFPWLYIAEHLWLWKMWLLVLFSKKIPLGLCKFFFVPHVGFQCFKLKKKNVQYDCSQI